MALGLRAPDEIIDEKMLPIPEPTPPSPITARPAPINFAASTSIFSVP
jgi:hypothetical protein